MFETYNFHEIEKECQSSWFSSDKFAAKKDSSKKRKREDNANNKNKKTREDSSEKDKHITIIAPIILDFDPTNKPNIENEIDNYENYENSDRPSKNIVYPIAILLLIVFGYSNSKRNE